LAAPAWADRIVREVARARRQPAPILRWRRTRNRRSAGSAGSYLDKEPSVSVAAGRDPLDQRLVLCHELAHWLGRPDEGHTPAYWQRAWRLFRRYRVPIHYALAREGAYEGAVQAYRAALRKARSNGTGRNSRRPR
jgi:hypothetical protein